MPRLLQCLGSGKTRPSRSSLEPLEEPGLDIRSPVLGSVSHCPPHAFRPAVAPVSSRAEVAGLVTAGTAETQRRSKWRARSVHVLQLARQASAVKRSFTCPTEHMQVKTHLSEPERSSVRRSAAPFFPPGFNVH